MKIIRLKEVNSTNEYVKEHARDLKDETVVYAERQTAGHGRLGRIWFDTGEDNLFMTLFLKPFDEIIPLYSNFTQYLSVVLANILEKEYGLTPKIKWPNDVLIDGAKIAGILSECTTQSGKFTGLALGLGVNLNTSPENLAKIDKPAASVYSLTGMKIDREIFLQKLLTEFFLLYDKFKAEGFLSVKESYIKRADFLGKNISINVLGQIHEGKAIEITDEGALVLIENSQRKVYFMGDIL